MTYCENCRIHLTNNKQIQNHLLTSHSLRIRLEDSLMVYCEDCKKYITHVRPRCNERKLGLEKHLLNRHSINIHEDQSKEYTITRMIDVEDDIVPERATK